VILEREALKWFKPAKGQFQIYYKQGAGHPAYQPDFVAETESVIYMLEPKARNEMEDPIVLAKKEVAVKWCERQRPRRRARRQALEVCAHPA
jgi:type III restriction enzyme